MTTNLTDKFTTFQDLTTTHHNALMDALSGLNTTLGILDNKLEYDAGDQVLFQAQIAYLQLIQNQNTVDRLDSLITLLTETNSKLDTANSQLNAISGTNTEISDFLNIISGSIGVPTFPDFALVPQAQLTNSLLNDIITRLGTPTGDATSTVLGRLSTIENLSRCGCGATGPTSAPCDSPYISEATTWVPAIVFGNPVLVAVFPDPPPDGVDFGSTFGIGVDRSELNTATSWEGWQVFVKSNGETYQLAPGDPARYPTNQWLELHGSTPLSFSVDERYDLTVYLCGPTELPGECGTFSSIPVTTPWGAETQAVSWSGSDFTSTNTGPTGTFSANIFNTSPLNGWWVFTEQSDVRMNRTGGDSSLDVFILPSDEWFEITGPTPYLHFYSNSTTFTIELCPEPPV